MADQQFCLRWNNHQSTLISVFDNLLENNILVDCTLAAEGQYLKAHKVVLCACSPYLELVLSQHSERHPILILKDVKFQELRTMMNYMYKGEVNISQEHLETFLKTAESLQIKGLTDCGSKDGFKDASSTSQTKRHEPQQHSRKSLSAPQLVSSTSPVGGPYLHSSPALSEANVKQMSSSHMVDVPLDASPSSRERTPSPVPRKRKRARRPSQTDSEHYDAASDTPLVQTQSSASSVNNNNVPLANQILTTSTPSVTGNSKMMPVDGEQSLTVADIARYAALSVETSKKEKLDSNHEDIIVPKTEFFDEINEDGVEDLTMDDEMDNMDGGPGPSHSAENSNQGYSWQMSGERSSDEIFANQDATQQDSQVVDKVTGEIQRSTNDHPSRRNLSEGSPVTEEDADGWRINSKKNPIYVGGNCKVCGKYYKHDLLVVHKLISCCREAVPLGEHNYCPYCLYKNYRRGNLYVTYRHAIIDN